MNNSFISIEEAASFVTRNPALVIGPGATCYPGVLSDVRLALIARFPDLPLPQTAISLFELADIVETLYPDRLSQFKDNLLAELERLVPSPDLSVIARFNWVASIALTPDMLFERALQSRLDRNPLSRTVTVIASSNVVVPVRTIPAYRLLGIPRTNDPAKELACSLSDLLLRQAQWPQILATFPDYLKQSPLFLVGTADVPEIAANFLAATFAGPRPHPGTLVFLKGDPTLSLPTVSALLRRSGATILVADGTARELIGALERAKGPAKSTPIVIGGAGSEKAKAARNVLASLQYLADVVPTDAGTTDKEKPGRDIIDALFRPTSSDWRPYQQNIGLERTQHSRLLHTCKELSTQSALRTISVHGPAGVGKTTMLRQLAVAVSSEGNLVLWCRRALTDSTTRMARLLISAARDVLTTDSSLGKTLFIFVDDPWSLRISPADLMAQIEGMSAVLVFSTRSSDYSMQYATESILPWRPDAEIEMSHELDKAEIARLPPFLVTVGAAAAVEQAQNLVDQNPYKNAADILCSLWYLIPETRSQFQASLEDEYGRLGDAQAAIEGVAAGALRAGDIARSAYEVVTAVSSLGVGLPVEILVRALGVDYKDWLPLAEPGKPLWGLLYDEYVEVNESYVYRTRNEIVTRVLLRLVNGVLGGHSGQCRLIHKLLESCTIAAPAYRTFIHDVLIRSRAKLQQILSFEQGLDLYNTAIAASPYPDRSLEHHKGIWIKDVGKDLLAADTQFRKALEIPDYPGSTREELREFIHTSIAATVLAEVRGGLIAKEAGFERITDHLRRANASPFFNANQSHVLANCYYEMAQLSGPPGDNVRLTCLNEALTEIERSLQMIGAAGKESIRFQSALEFFSELQGKVIESVTECGDLNELALSLFERLKSQTGFELHARKLFAEATRTNSGSDYNKVAEYLARSVSLIESKKHQPSLQLVAIRIDLIIRWRLQQVKGAVDWQKFANDLETVLRAPRFRDDRLKKFYYAVALYQLGKITDANVIFSDLRRGTSISAPNAIRCYYIGTTGFPKRFQGTSHASGGRTYITVEELGDDVLTHGRFDVGPGGTLHVYIGFTANGPLALAKTASPGELLLPTA